MLMKCLRVTRAGPFHQSPFYKVWQTLKNVLIDQRNKQKPVYPNGLFISVNTEAPTSSQQYNLIITFTLLSSSQQNKFSSIHPVFIMIQSNLHTTTYIYHIYNTAELTTCKFSFWTPFTLACKLISIN